MTRRIAGFIFRRQREVANIGTVLNLLWLVECQHVQRGIALHQLFDIVFQQRADNDARTILLNLRQYRQAASNWCRRFSAQHPGLRWWWPPAVFARQVVPFVLRAVQVERSAVEVVQTRCQSPGLLESQPAPAW